MRGRIVDLKDRHTLIVQPATANSNTIKINTLDYAEHKRRGGMGPEPRRVVRSGKPPPGPQSFEMGNVKHQASVQADLEATTLGLRRALNQLDEVAELNEAEVLEYLEDEVRDDRVYTRTGSVLVAMNPFKWLLSYYGDNAIKRYHCGDIGYDEAPHLYQDAETVSTVVAYLFVC